MNQLREIATTVIVVGLILAAFHSLLRPRHDIRGYEFLPGMVQSKALESFSASPLLPGGLVQQQLVHGVIPRGARPFPYGEGTEEATRAGQELSNPFADATGKDLDRGRELFGIYCAICHGPSGDGDGRAVLHGMVPPPNLHAERARTLPDGTLMHILTRGQGNMASYEAQISLEDRWRIIRWVRELQGGER